MAGEEDLRAVRTEIMSLSQAHPKLREETIAERLVDSLSRETLRRLAIGMLCRWIWKDRRDSQLEIEAAAARERVVEAQGKQAADDLRRSAERDQEAEARRVAVFKDPSVCYGSRSRGSSLYYIFSGERDAFRTWCAERFSEWYERAEKVITDDPDLNDSERDMFYEHWEKGSALVRALNRGIAAYSAGIKLELTQQLLRSEFALGDGRRVTWADATRDDHITRIELLTLNAAGNAEAAARHHAAIRMLDEAEAGSLKDIGVG